jgi:hypothetical protein
MAEIDRRLAGIDHISVRACVLWATIAQTMLLGGLAQISCGAHTRGRCYVQDRRR